MSLQGHRRSLSMNILLPRKIKPYARFHLGNVIWQTEQYVVLIVSGVFCNALCQQRLSHGFHNLYEMGPFIETD